MKRHLNCNCISYSQIRDLLTLFQMLKFHLEYVNLKCVFVLNAIVNSNFEFCISIVILLYSFLQ